ncbi:protein NRT1/ PTR FAMILY 2.11-like [Phoenix dactylifera]|uniref:Protein NRT1/ PTR FAMILY 2.11-like n=1 Tax=Phoenix dactylifera TaxID=42345 RepID=A0A8B7CW67_PHODC|nr:protein NRT1/ PTR FAMILY 2.11-like [Phoenix dactylifera]
MAAATGGDLEAMEESENGTAVEPQVKYRGWKAMPYVIGNETFEKLGSIGIASNLLVYLTTIFHLKSVTAATTLNVFNGTTNLATVIGAFIADSNLGRYTTLGFACIASLMGMLVVTLTAAISELHPAPCTQGEPCTGPTTLQLAILLVGFAFLVIGAGGIRPCNLSFGADQFDPNTGAGKKGINSFFNWYYFTFTLAVAVSSTIIIYIQSEVSWAWGFAIPTVLMFLACAFFYSGSKIYVKVKPEGSPFTSIAQVLVVAFRKRGLKLPAEPEKSLFNPPHASSLVSKLPYTNQFNFLDKASIVSHTDEVGPNGFASNPWRLCSIQQVEEVKCVLRVIPIWSTAIIYYVAFSQQSTYIILQALQSDRHLWRGGFEIPAASFTIFPMLALAIWIPLYDRVIVSKLEKFTGKEGGITLLQRMGIGIIFSVVAMIISAVIEDQRRKYALRLPTVGIMAGGGGGAAVSSMSSLWLIAPLMLLGLSEAFNMVSQLEFYYKQFPENMRSVAGSLLFCGIAIASYLSGLLVTIVHNTTGAYGKENWLAEDLNKGRLDLFYILIAVIGVINFFLFLAFAKWYRYKGLDDGSDSDLEREQVLQC